MRYSIGVTALVWLAGSACGEASASRAPATQGKQDIVIVDLSSSRSPDELAVARRLAADVIARLEFGDRVVFLEANAAGLAGKNREWKKAMPRRRSDPPSKGDRRRLAEAIEAARGAPEVFFDSSRAGRIGGTDLFATFHRASEFIRAEPGVRTRIVVLSDMLQSTRELDMERAGGVPDEAWVRRRVEQRLIPSLRGACVVVVGADPTSAKGVAVRDFWAAWFAAAGASMDETNWRFSAPDVGSLACS